MLRLAGSSHADVLGQENIRDNGSIHTALVSCCICTRLLHVAQPVRGPSWWEGSCVLPFGDTGGRHRGWPTVVPTRSLPAPGTGLHSLEHVYLTVCGVNACENVILCIIQGEYYFLLSVLSESKCFAPLWTEEEVRHKGWGWAHLALDRYAVDMSETLPRAPLDRQ